MLKHRNMLKKTKAQAFTQDLVIAMVIMSIIIIAYFSFYTNQDFEGESYEQELLSEARTITDYVISEGYPTDWNISNVARIGITDDNNVINRQKLESFNNMTRDDYDNTRTLLRTKYDYVIFFIDYEENIQNVSGVTFIGKPGINSTNLDASEDPHYISKISRFVVIKEGDVNITSRIIEMVTYVWSKKR